MWNQMNKMKSITIANDYNIACIFHLFYSLLAFIWIYVWGQICLCFWQGKYVLSKPCNRLLNAKNPEHVQFIQIIVISRSIGNRVLIRIYQEIIFSLWFWKKIGTKRFLPKVTEIIFRILCFNIFSYSGFFSLFFGRKCLDPSFFFQNWRQKKLHHKAPVAYTEI